MNAAFWRVVWKEYRAVRGFWIAVVVLAVLVQIAFVAVIGPGGDRVTSVYATALGAAALFVVGCLAAAFAAEREEETLRFLQIVPGKWPPVMGGKFAFASVSTAALIGTLFATAAAMVGGSPFSRENLVDALAVFGVAVVECAAWAALFSLLSRRPLVAAVGAIGVASMATHVAIWLADPGRTQVWSAATYRDAWHTRLALAAGVAVVAGLVSRRWLSGTLGGKSRHKRPRLFGRETQAAEAAPTLASTLPRGRAFPIVGRLVWQSCRQWWWIALLVIILAGPVVGIIAHMLSVMSESPLEPWWIGLAAIVGALLGSLVFLSDQEGRQYRFFAERAERPGLVWLARLVFWGTTLFLLAAVMHAGLAYSLLKAPYGETLEVVDQYLRDRSNGSGGDWHFHRLLRIYDEAWSHATAVGFSAVMLACGFCIGQFCSMAVKSGVIAGFAAVIGSLFVVGWGALMVAWQLDGHLKWSLVLVPLCLLLATRLRARGWMLERKNVRAWMLPVNVLMVPMAVFVLSVPSSRLDLPTNDWIRFSATEFALALEDFEGVHQSLESEGREAADLYFRGCDLVVTWQSFINEAGLGNLPPHEYEAWTKTDEYHAFRDRWLEQNAEPLALALDAARHETCFFPASLSSGRRVSQFDELQIAVRESGNHLLRQGDLEGALDRYVAALQMTNHFRQGHQTWTWTRISTQPTLDALARWARAEGQSPALLSKAIQSLESYEAERPTIEDAVLADHVHLRSILTGELDLDVGGVPLEGWRMQLAYIGHQLPWERQRALSVLDALSGERFQTARNFSRAIEGHLPINEYIIEWDDEIDSTDVKLLKDESPYSWLESTYLLHPLYDHLQNVRYVLWHEVKREQRRRALLLETALIAYRLEHGEYPENLYELANAYLAEVPEDLFGVRPVVGQVVRDLPFRYHPVGLDGWLRSPEHGFIAPGTPLLWSGGMHYGSASLLIDEQAQSIPLEFDQLGNVVRLQDLQGRPLYLLTGYYYDDGLSSSSISVYVLPSPDGGVGVPRAGRDPRDEGIQVVPIHSNAYGSPARRNRNAWGMSGPYSAAGGYGSGVAPYASSNNMDGLPPGYDLPPVQ